MSNWSTNVKEKLAYEGVSTDTKPTAGVLSGALANEIDTQVVHVFDGAAWIPMPGFVLGKSDPIIPSLVVKSRYSTTSQTFGAILTAATVTKTVALAGVKVTDTVDITVQGIPDGIIVQGYVSAAGVVTIKATNITLGTITFAVTTFNIAVSRA